MKKIINFENFEQESFEQENNSITINVLFVSHNSEKIKLAYKSSYNKRKIK